MRDVLVGVGDPFLVHPAGEEEDEGDEGDGEEAFGEVSNEVKLGREEVWGEAEGCGGRRS